MTISRHLGKYALVLFLAVAVLELGKSLSVPGMQHGFIADAQARVGRPLTPVRVAGVARRTVPRCGVGVYNC